MAIGVCVSHKLADAATMSVFLKTWARTAVPDFDAASHYRPAENKNNFSFVPPTAVELKRVEGVSKRFVLDKSEDCGS